MIERGLKSQICSLLNEIVFWMMVKKARGMKVLVYNTGREADKNRSKEKPSLSVINVLYLH